MQLHVVEELLELFGINTVFNDDEQAPAPAPAETVMAISRSALTGGVAAKVFQLRAWIQGHEVLMLVDSGSSTSFLNQQLAKKLDGVQQLPWVCKVCVADGGELLCNSQIPHCSWGIQGSEFHTDMKILALGMYDTILGMDWLEAHRPMTVDWRAKLIEIPTPTGKVCLRGHESTSSTCLSINFMQLQSMCKIGVVSYIVYLCSEQSVSDKEESVPPCIQEVLAEFPAVFGEPEGLHPRRACDHRIPLIPGVQPINIQPYRHKPDHLLKLKWKNCYDLVSFSAAQVHLLPRSSW